MSYPSSSLAQIRMLQRASDGTLQPRVEDGASLLTAIAERSTLLWIDIFDPSEGEDAHVVRLLREEFRFHPLAVDDALDESHLPKVDDWGEYVYLVLHTVSFDANLSHVRTHELDVFVGRNYLVTYHTEPLPTLERLWQSVQRDDRRGAARTTCSTSSATLSPATTCLAWMRSTLRSTPFKVKCSRASTLRLLSASPA